MSRDLHDGSLGQEICPECGEPGFYHDSAAGRHICINQECGYAVDDEGESILTKLLKLLRLKKK
ncbi:MAG: hypothetical protein HN929_08510 [Chloroflexi bacterium]|jgi:hypothetical protein|nr:hypothetical protein [Chloroflexota bacterium]MBT7081492.1 hypothetical protein [Chloroflexota bacterium]MBT7290700.1 hypothetical protein [Chloroflexota bacterium]